MRYLGIDPGLDGGMCLIDEEGVIDSCVMPTLRDPKGKRVFDPFAIKQWVKERNGLGSESIKCCGIEKPIPMPSLPSNVLLSLGYGNGILVGIMTALDIPFLLINAKEWQKNVLRHITSGTTKQRSIQYAQQTQPKYDWRENDRCRIPHDGLADSYCIATYIQSL